MNLEQGILLTKKVKSRRRLTEQEYIQVAEFWEYMDDLQEEYERLADTRISKFIERNADDIYESLLGKISSLKAVISSLERTINEKVQQIKSEIGGHKDYETIKSLEIMRDDWALQSYHQELSNVKRALFNCIPHLKRIKIHYSEGNYDELVERARHYPVASLVKQGKARRTGNKIMAFSPLREERTPSFCIYLNNNTWYDFGGGEGGDVITLFMKLNGCDFKDAVKALSSL